MTTKTLFHFSFIEKAAAFALGSLALLMTGLQPALLGELTAQHQITMEGVGLVAMGEIFALGFGVILSDKFLSLSHLRWIAGITMILLVIVNVLMVKITGDTAFILLRVFAGLIEGVMFWLTTSVIIRTSNPDQMAGLLLMVLTLVQALVAFILARYIMPTGGWQSGFMVMAFLSLLSLLLLPLLPARLATLVDDATAPVAPGITLYILAVPFAFSSAIGALWAYMDPLGRMAGFDAISVQTLIAWTLIMQIVGSAVAVCLVKRLPMLITMTLGSIIVGGVALLMHILPFGHISLFASACLLFGFVWQFILPFQIRLAIAAEPTGRVAMLVPATQLLGFAFGPLIASFSVTGDDAVRVPLVSMGFVVFALLALFIVRMRHSGAGTSGGVPTVSPT